LTSVSDDDAWDVLIVSKRSLFDLRLGELWRYRDLISLFVRRNFVVTYRQTILGPIWYIVQPLTTTAVFTLIFGVIARMPTDGISSSLFYLSGIVMWSNFSSNLVATSDVFVTNMAVFGKVYFPRLTVPIATVLTSFVTLLLHLAIFLAFLMVEIASGRAGWPGIWIVLSPLLFAANAIFAVGLGLILSSLTTRYRDLISVVGFGTQLLMYATPVIYPLSQIPERWRALAAVNPLSTSIEMFRTMAFGSGSISVPQVMISSVVVVGTVATGLLLFSRAEQSAADTV
jgi:lipopolysaccharide transport system permease protein